MEKRNYVKIPKSEMEDEDESFLATKVDFRARERKKRERVLAKEKFQTCLSL